VPSKVAAFAAKMQGTIPGHRPAKAQNVLALEVKVQRNAHALEGIPLYFNNLQNAVSIAQHLNNGAVFVVKALATTRDPRFVRGQGVNARVVMVIEVEVL